MANELGSREECFIKIFGAPYHSSTYDGQVKVWKDARAELKTDAQNAGRTPEGLWSTFAKKVRKEGKNKVNVL